MTPIAVVTESLSTNCLTRSASAQDVLSVGEHVRCVVLGMEDDFSRISLSTAELEEHDGDMKRDKVRFSSVCSLGCLSMVSTVWVLAP